MKTEWKLVPVEPTPDMTLAGAFTPGHRTSEAVWAAMLAASPTPPPSDRQALELDATRRRGMTAFVVRSALADAGIKPSPGMARMIEQAMKRYDSAIDAALGREGGAE